ncbi:MAG: M20/M25/M40 family metallo-hydrolase [Clostridiales bacterium]|nr:M20/M25/M40 family metallo-hydrolase [Clostridiales bacterium]
MTPETERYAQRLARMIRCKTVSVKDSYDDTEFAKLRSVMEELFPRVHQRMERRIFSDDCWVYKLAGKDPSRSIMLMSHHDVVAAESNWEHDPFGAEIAEGRLWGRGTVDTKTPLFAEFSALEELLAQGWEPPCNVFLGSSHNEELGGDGIPTALAYFKDRGLTFEVVLDEGGAIIDPPLGGMKCEKCAMVAVHEKGRYKLNCTAAAANVHTGLTAAAQASPIERMAGFLNEAASGKLFIRRLNPQVRAMFAHLAPHCKFPMNLVLGNLWLTGPLLQKIMPKLNAQAGAMLGTVCSFSKIEGDDKGCTTTVSFKAVDGDDMARDLDALREAAKKYGVEIEIDPASEYHEPADMGRPAFAYTMERIAAVFPDYPAVPFILPAGTDARWLTDICPCVLRFAPIRLSAQQLGSVHSENENIDLDAIADAVAFYTDFLRNYR